MFSFCKKERRVSCERKKKEGKNFAAVIDYHSSSIELWKASEIKKESERGSEEMFLRLVDSVT